MTYPILRNRDGFGPDGRRLYFKGGGGSSAKYANLEDLYEEQAASARLLREQAEANLPGAVQSYVAETQEVLDPGYAERQAGLAGADMAAANAQERAATERNLASMGVNPNDARFAGSMRDAELSNAVRMAAGKNIARNEANQYQLNVAKDTVGTFTGQSNNAATQTGNAASGLGSLYASQANQKMAADQAQSNAIGNTVAGGMAAWSMMKDGGKVKGIGGLGRLKKVERHMLGGTAGGQQNQGFFQMQAIAPPPVAQAPQQQASMLNPTSMASTMKAGKDFKAGGGLEGAAARNTDKIGRVAGVFDEQAGNQIQSYSRGMTMSPDQANAASDAYIEAAKATSDPALAESYMNTATNIQAGAGGQVGAAPVAEAAITPVGEAAGAAATAAGTAAAEGAATTAATAAAETAATTGLGAAAGAIGTALPWVGAAYAVGSLLDWWADGGEVGTQNKGMSEAEAMQRFAQAERSGSLQDLRPGGAVPGKWQGNTDNVPALLTEGEHVINAEAAKAVGHGALERLNKKGLAMRKQGKTPDTIKKVGLGALA